MTPTLRPYQHDALEAVWSAFTHHRQNRVLVKMPTGTGKTVMFAAMLPTYAARWELLVKGRTRGARMLVIAHREELLDQAAEKIRAANPGLMVAVEQGDRHANPYADAIVASIQTLAALRFRRLKRLLQWHDVRLVIVDEAHHAAAASYRTALVHLGFLPPADASDRENIEAPDYDDVAAMAQALQGWDATAARDRLLVGVTATPNRSDAIGLGCVFQTIAYNYALKAAIDDGYLVPIRPWVIESKTSLDDVKITAGDFNQRDLAAAVNQDVRNKLALAAWRAHAPDRATLAFTVDVAHAHALAEVFRRDGVAAAAVSGDTPKEERRSLLHQFRHGTIQVLTNCMVLTEGTDLPMASCILHAKPTKSATLYEQMTGRGLRLADGKRDCVVLDIVDVARRHSLQTAPVLYGLPPGLLPQGRDLDTLTADLDAFRDAHPSIDVDSLLASGRLTLEQLNARASTFDIWKVPDLGEFSSVVDLNWIRLGPDRFKLSYPWEDGHEVLTVEPDMLGKYAVVATLRTAVEGGGWQTRQRTLSADAATASEALRLAEAYVQHDRRAAARLRSREAPWRARPASEKQLELLRKWRVPHAAQINAGQASDLIDMAKLRRVR